MKTIVTIVRQYEDNEETVDVAFENFELTCFINSCPFQLETGGNYPAELSLTTLDDFIFDEIEGDPKSYFRKLDGYRYEICGKVKDGSIYIENLGLESDFLRESPYLDGQAIRCIADRISIDFYLKP
jgi:hypothetical protein